MVVAMAPGEEELEQDKPLVGPTGNMLWTLLEKHGITRADCFMLNVIGEWPEKKDGPSPAQYAKYWDSVDTALRAFTGEVVLILGKDALWRITGLKGIESWRGFLIEPTDELPHIDKPSYETGIYKSGPKKGLQKFVKKNLPVTHIFPKNIKWIIPTLHPSGVMRTGLSTLPVLAADVDRAVRAINGALGTTRIDYTTKPSYIPEAKYCAFDIETPNGYLERIGIATEFGTWTSPWNEEAKRCTQAYLENPNIIKIAQNAPFDVGWLLGAGMKIDLPTVYDTMMMAVLLQPDLPKGLNYLGSLYTDCKRHKHLNYELPEFYNARDASQELEIFHVLYAELVKTKQWDLFCKIIMPGIWTFMRMSHTGMYLDPDKRDAWIKRLEDKLGVVRAAWYELHPTINPTSILQLKGYFYGTKGCKYRYDKYGSVTVNELALIDTKLEYPDLATDVDLILEIRGLSKDLETYAKVVTSLDGCVHPSYLPRSKDDDKYDDDGHKLGKEIAGTWRPTAKRPNIQNQSQDARFMYVCRKKGYTFVKADFSAFEARILAALSKDMELQKAIENGLHKHNMELLQVDKVRAKNGFYGWSYGAGAPTLRKTFRLKGFDVPLKACKAMLKAFDAKYNKAAAWRDGQIALAKIQFFVENPFGLRRYFYTKSAGTAPSNTPIQSTAAMIVWKIMPEVEALCNEYDALLIAMVHDELDFEVPEDRLPEFSAKLRMIMQQPFPNIGPGFYVPVEIKNGPSWGECK